MLGSSGLDRIHMVYRDSWVFRFLAVLSIPEQKRLPGTEMRYAGSTFDVWLRPGLLKALGPS